MVKYNSIYCIFCFFILTFNNVFPQENKNNNKIGIGRFISFESDSLLELEFKIKERISKELKTKYEIVIFDDTREKNLVFARENKFQYYIEGYYLKNSAKNTLTIYIQLYNPESGKIVDALMESNDINELLGEGFEDIKNPNLISEDTLIDKVGKSTLISLLSNPNKTEIRENINEKLLATKLAKKFDFPLQKQTEVEQGREFLKELENNEIITASRSKESRLDAPASMIVLTIEEMRQRGYTSLDEVLYDLPGFDISFSNGVPYIIGYQRGYRTQNMSRTLFLIDGKINNELFSQNAELSRQIPLANIKRIEILYGPASVIYGANAFQGIINIITFDGKSLVNNSSKSFLSLQAGSFQTKSIDGVTYVKRGEWTFAASGKLFQSNEPNLRNKEGYFNDIYYNSSSIWGPMRYHENNGVRLWRYHDPSLNKGAIASIGYKDLKVGIISWSRDEGYGTQYAGDKVQNNSLWSIYNHQAYLEFDSKISEKLSLYSLVTYRNTGQKGNFVESNRINSDSSLISNTRWNTANYSWLFNQNLEYKFTNQFKLTTGLKFEQKYITKTYDIPGYFKAYDSNLNYSDRQIDLSSIYPNGYAVGNTNDPVYLSPPKPNSRMPRNNIASISDFGGFLLTTFDLGKFRFSPGIRYDENSIYSSTVNPRITTIYRLNNQNSLKFLYGEAFQEPAFIFLFGSFSGRGANPNLKPEKAKSTEFIYLRQTNFSLNEISIYYSRYENVLELNEYDQGKRRIYGFEFKNQLYFQNFITASSKINLYMYYTFTESLSSVRYNYQSYPSPNWLYGESILGKYDFAISNNIQAPMPREESYRTLGDISPHKINFGINLPIKEKFNINLRVNYVGKRQLYSRNILQQSGITTDAYTVLNAAFTYNFLQSGFFTFKILNLLNHFYFHPGVEAATAGNYYFDRSQGFNSSLLPQPGRSFLISINWEF